MDSPTGFDDEAEFFASYDAEQASAARFELDAEEAQPPTPEELAHRARFRRPVAIVVSSLAFLSIVALGVQGSLQRDPQRELVAHYGAALTSPNGAALAAPTRAPVATEAVKRHALPEASSALVPEALTALLMDALSALVPEPISGESAAQPALAASAAGPALEPPPEATTLTEFSAQPDSAQPDSDSASVFVSVSKQMCLRPAASNRGPRQSR